MPSQNSNTTVYITRPSRYPAVNIPSGTAANSITLIATADATYGSIVTDIVIRNLHASAINFDFIMCPTGSQATAEYARTQFQVPANSGNSGSTLLYSFASFAYSIFDLDMAGNRVLTLEAGQSLYLRNITLTTAAMYVTTKMRDYTP